MKQLLKLEEIDYKLMLWALGYYREVREHNTRAETLTRIDKIADIISAGLKDLQDARRHDNISVDRSKGIGENHVS